MHSTLGSLYGESTSPLLIDSPVKVVVQVQTISFRSCLIGGIADPPQLLGDGAAPHHGARDGRISVDLPETHHLTHVQVHTQTEA